MFPKFPMGFHQVLNMFPICFPSSQCIPQWCSQYVSQVPNVYPNDVPNMFPKFLMCSSRVFPIVPPFNPMCFVQNPPLLTFIGGPKVVALHLSRMLYFGEPPQFHFFFWDGPIKLAHYFFFKKKVGLARHPQLINMKQNKYPQNKEGEGYILLISDSAIIYIKLFPLTHIYRIQAHNFGQRISDKLWCYGEDIGCTFLYAYWPLFFLFLHPLDPIGWCKLC
jgi:hypothetical protein